MDRVVSIQKPTHRQVKEVKGWAYCPICTHIVETQVLVAGKDIHVKRGGKCPRCSSSLEPAAVVRYESATAA